MKLPALHKYYTVNFALYLTFLQMLSLIFGYNYLHAVGPLPFIFMMFLLISFCTITPVNVLLIGLEFLLRKLKWLTRENTVTLSDKQKKIIYIAGIIGFVICLAYFCYITLTPPKYPYSEYD